MFNCLCLDFAQAQSAQSLAWDWPMKWLGIMAGAVLLIVISPFLGKLLPRRTSSSPEAFPGWAAHVARKSGKKINANT